MQGKEQADALDLSDVNCEELVRGVWQALYAAADWTPPALEIEALFIEAGLAPAREVTG